MGGNSNVINSPAFKKWFGNSKVVDVSGNPLVVYHGSIDDFHIFDTDKICTDETNAIYNGFWFTSKKEYASPAWANPLHVKSYYLRLKNPAPIKVVNDTYRDIMNDKCKINHCKSRSSYPDMLRYKLLEMGYDGVIHKDTTIIDIETFNRVGIVFFKSTWGISYLIEKDEQWGGINLYYADGEFITGYGSLGEFLNFQNEKVYVVFKPNQIKITDNIGTFDTMNFDVRY
jgi:hypothetical protein